MDPLLLIGSLTAIALLVGLNLALGGWSTPTLSALEDADALIAADGPAFERAAGVLAEDGRAALLAENCAQRFALVAARGDKWVTRQFARADIVGVTLDARGRLVLRLADFTFPSVRIVLSPQDAAEWRERLTPGEDTAHA